MRRRTKMKCYLKIKYRKLISNKSNCIILIVGLFFVLLLTVVAIKWVNDEVYHTEGTPGDMNQGQSISEIQSELQQIVDDNMFRIKINERLSRNDETGAINILVQNSMENMFNKKVTYYDSEGLVIYETRELYPGDNELSAVFPGDWEKGQHMMMAEVMAVDVEKKEEFIVATIEIILTVK